MTETDYNLYMRSPELVVESEVEQQQAMSALIGVFCRHEEIGKHINRVQNHTTSLNGANGDRLTLNYKDNLTKKLQRSTVSYDKFLETFKEVFPYNEDREHVIHTAEEDFDRNFNMVMHGTEDVSDLSDEAVMLESAELKMRTHDVLKKLSGDLGIDLDAPPLD